MGVAVLGCATPIVSENEAIFLRSLVGRTATMLHTVGSRHNLKALYADVIINEARKDGDDKRMKLWVAWIQFIGHLAGLKTRSMKWQHGLQTSLTTDQLEGSGASTMSHLDKV
jgi:hypothetical protein